MFNLSTHLYLLVLKEKEDEEARPSLQSETWPPDLLLPESTLEGVADGVWLDSIESRAEVEGDVRSGMPAAPALEVHLEPGRGGVRV